MIKLEHVSKSFNDIEVLKDINLSIPSQAFFGIIGTSGAGKSTLIRLINGLEKPSSGKVIVPEDEKISMIFQNHALLKSKTVYENIQLALKFDKTHKNQYKDKITKILDYVGILDKINSYPSELSGGQKQRVGIARALVTNPSVLLCDEITSALDPKSKKTILNLLKKIQKEFNTTIILVTHEMEVIKEVCDEVAVLDNGDIIECQSIERLFLHPKNEIVKSFLSDIIYPMPPAKGEIDESRYSYYLLMDFEQYLKFQKLDIDGFIYDSKTISLNGKRFVSFYYVAKNKIDNLELDYNSLRHERISLSNDK